MKRKLRGTPCSFTYFCNTSILLFPAWSFDRSCNPKQHSPASSAKERSCDIVRLCLWTKYISSECSYEQCFHKFFPFFIIKRRKERNWSLHPKLLVFSVEDAFYSTSETLSFCAEKSNYGTHPLFKESASAEDSCLSFIGLPGQQSSTFSK